jgi:TetR/AcrR family transcriptional regulator, transcriptional repressor of aconitase
MENLPLDPDTALHRSPDSTESGVDEKQGLRERILLTAREQYMRLGFSRVTMDETASAMGISKKTLYQHFESKEDLVKAVCDHHQVETDAGLRDIHQNPHWTPLEKLRRQSAFISEVFARLSPSLIHDLQRSQPEIWRQVQESRKHCIETYFVDLVREVQKQGTFRSDIDERVFLKVYMAAIDGVIQPAVLAELPLRPDEVYETVSRILFEGFLTDTARMDYHVKT